MNDKLNQALLAAVHKLNEMPSRWRIHASGDGSALYRAGFEHCADELERALENLTVRDGAIHEVLALRVQDQPPQRHRAPLLR